MVSIMIRNEWLKGIDPEVRKVIEQEFFDPREHGRIDFGRLLEATAKALLELRKALAKGGSSNG